MLKNKKVILKNGLRLLFLEKKNSQAVGLGMAINAGPYVEDDGAEGIFHLLEHLIGRNKEGAGSLREEVYKEGGIVDASTSVSETFYYLYSLPESLNDLTKILTEGVFHPNFSDLEVKKSKESVLSELSFNNDFSSYEILRQMMWKDKRLSRAISGTKDSVLGITRAQLEKYHKTYYAANNMSVVVISSKLDDGLIFELENIPANFDLKKPEINTQIKKPSYRIFQERNLHTIAAFSFPTKGFINLGENRHLFTISATSLNDFFATKLGEKGLVYEANWNWNIFPESGDFVVVLESLANSHVLQALEEGLKLVSNWSQNPLTQKKFDLLKNHRILDLKISASLVDALPLFTRNFSSSEEAHTYEEAISVYENADLKSTIKTVDEVLLSKTPYTVVDLGADSLELLGKINQLLEDYYKSF